jgi:DnaJ-class molecular chaperone
VRWRTLKSRHVPRVEILRRCRPHELLGVAESASETEIKAAYRRQARAYHPDHVVPFLKAHSEEVMKLVNAAYNSMLARRRR